MSRVPDAVLPPLSTLLRNNSSTSSGGSSSPPLSPRTPHSVEGPVSGFFEMDAKRRAAPPPPLTALPSLSSSIPLTRKPSDERNTISSLLNGQQQQHQQHQQHQHQKPRRLEYDHPVPPHHPASQAPPYSVQAHSHPQAQAHHPVPPHHHPAPPSGPVFASAHPQNGHPYPGHQPEHGHSPLDHPAHQGLHRPHYSQQQHYHPSATGPPPPPPPPLSAPLMPASTPPAPPRGYFSPPPTRHSYDYRPPTAPHPEGYVRPDMGRRHTYHPAVYEYPVPYEVGMPMPYPSAYIGVPFDGGLGARAPISRTTKACDACRSRKVRCDAGGMPGQTGTCSRCRESGRLCNYTATQKKRGPTPGRPARAQSSVNATVPRRSSLEAPNASVMGDARQSWSSGRPPTSAGLVAAPGGPSRSPTGYPPHSAPNEGWSQQFAYDEREVRHHPYRPPTGLRTASLAGRELRGPQAGWEPQAPQPQSALQPVDPSYHHEPRQPPVFDADYSLRPHPTAGWPQHQRREYPYPAEYPRRSVSPQGGSIRLAPLRRK